MAKSAKSRRRLYEVTLDEATIPRGTAEQDHERAVAIFDLVEDNAFGVPERDDGPFSLRVSQLEGKLVFRTRTEGGALVGEFSVSMTPFRPLLKDYFLTCETYYAAIRHASPREIEAIDRERTALHNQCAEMMAERLKGKVDVDQATTRRLFTLISALHWRT